MILSASNNFIYYFEYYFSKLLLLEKNTQSIMVARNPIINK